MSDLYTGHVWDLFSCWSNIWLTTFTDQLLGQQRLYNRPNMTLWIVIRFIGNFKKTSTTRFPPMDTSPSHPLRLQLCLVILPDSKSYKSGLCPSSEEWLQIWADSLAYWKKKTLDKTVRHSSYAEENTLVLHIQSPTEFQGCWRGILTEPLKRTVFCKEKHHRTCKPETRPTEHQMPEAQVEKVL